uniref:CDP-diacylglycerol--glycerol-3-phosphate 3-phosphatidyltransferase n=1 Tax=Helicotheca tamesis TaxID=374047 RepID=A0A7S2HZT3_9STRA|mmetsp:Transcript_4215/g.5733  ORF Transcript_4215/g.5733 Transcript_4215/m.5733 type:complete len:307 (+) Transcript_4215:187-1107(+)|eukprot:CAMPEP_0185730372 /NCGR_PEP_ID=MMETSP1171-20130828/9714_1 /TAXON_ID=374046 /ORGANISM="Helicotheca tamensis, Strain CCMP826" /LENGTH=306 /DNA_ID=CAMNT_0028399403 /DNA_START=101 /DNA_END=1021 /DNA_ORIENTATION=-
MKNLLSVLFYFGFLLSLSTSLAIPSTKKAAIRPVTTDGAAAAGGVMYDSESALSRSALFRTKNAIHKSSSHRTMNILRGGGGKDEETPEPGMANMGPNCPPPGLLRRLFPSLPWHRLPDYLTYIRCLAIPALLGLYYSNLTNKHLYNGILFAVASYTDYLDGYLARRWDVTTAFGAFLDPVADKLMVSTALILLAGTYGSVVAIPASIILAREIAVSALREWMASRGLRDSVKVGYQGKVKTAATMVALTMMLLVPQSGAEGALWFKTLSKLHEPGMALLFLSAFVTVTSGSVYFRAAAPVLLEKE